MTEQPSSNDLSVVAANAEEGLLARQVRVDNFWKLMRAEGLVPVQATEEPEAIEVQVVEVRQIPREPATSEEEHALINLNQRLNAIFHKRRADAEKFRDAQYLLKAVAALELAIDEYQETLAES